MARAEGFSLLETLVALGVFSLSALALLNLTGENTRTDAILEERTLAAIVAENQMASIMTAPVAPAPGAREGTEEQGGRSWRWRLRVARTEDPTVLRIDVIVTADGVKTVSADLSYFRSVS